MTLSSLGCSDDVPSIGSGEETRADTESSSGDGDGDGDPGDGDGDPGDGDGDGEPLGCADQPGPWDYGYAIPKEPSPPGDPVAGLDALLMEDYVSCGVPWTLFPIMQPLLGSFGSGPPLAWREGKNAEVPVGWTVQELGDGSEMVAPNCFQCHAAELNGELILGLGRHDFDFTSDLYSVISAVPSLPAFNDAGDAFNKFLERFAVVGPAAQMRTVGTNSAIEFAFILVSHRNPYTLEWLDEPLQPLPEMLIPADPPPWWRAKKKSTQFANGMSRGDHRGTMILASSLCTDSAAEASVIFNYFDDITAYLESVEPPNYSLPVNQALAAEGAELFECNCEGCHGSYDSNNPDAETYPNLLVPLDVIGTDSNFASLSAGELNYLEEWFAESYFGTVSEVVTSDPFVGYVAPPLDSVWASAPFFHNGSVPTLELVLNSNARTTYWRRVDLESTSYDWDTLGWAWEEVDYGQDQAPLSERTFIYDTTLEGHDNGGHTFGDVFTDHERAAVLEYLKTI